jgi:serine/threonine-protein kinase
VFIAEDDERQPTIKLCDFGIAKLIDAGGEGSLETNTGALLGTPMYLAPEMLRGAGDAVPATDQWALGLLAFRALAGTEYFGHVRGFPGLVLAIANDPMVAPSQRAPSLPAAFDAWFLRSCARDPAARFPDVPAQVAALAAALGNPAPVPIAPFGKSGPTGAVRPAEPASDPAVAATWAAPHPAPGSRARLVLLATTVVWAVGALAAVSWLGGRSRAKPVAVASPAPATPAAAPSATSPPAAPPSSRAPTIAAVPRGEAPPAPAPEPPPAPAPPVAVKDKHAHRRHAESSSSASPPLRAEAPLPSAPTSRPAAQPPRGKAKGASCQRSAECASGLCAAETCL